MTKTPTNPRNDLDEIATSIRKLILFLENREIDGRDLTATEIDTLASQLQNLVEELLATSKRLRDEKPD
jgi:hypothetical protein